MELSLEEDLSMKIAKNISIKKIKKIIENDARNLIVLSV